MCGYSCPNCGNPYCEDQIALRDLSGVLKIYYSCARCNRLFLLQYPNTFIEVYPTKKEDVNE